MRNEIPWEAPPVQREEPQPAPLGHPAGGSRPEPSPAPQTAPTNVPGWPGWPAFLAQLKGMISLSDYSMINNPAMAEGRFDGRKLTIWTTFEVVKKIASSPAVTQPMAQLCQQLTGVAHQVEIRDGQAPPEEIPAAPPGAVDALDEFVARGGSNITVE